mgnify:CR=1 FL=1
MSLNATPSSERVHIGIFGKRNAGKSSLINAITGQNLAIVSEAKGTTTDPVYKAMELLPLGPVMIIDTPGIDDEGVLGSLRIQKAYQVLNKTDIALVIIDAAVGPSAEDLRLIKRINTKKIPLLIVINKCETINEDKKTAYQALLSNGKLLFVSAEQKLNIFELKEAIAQTVPADENKAQIVADLLSPSDFVVLVVPIDSAAPKGRLILPQQQTIRDILEADAAAIVVKENELTNTLQNLGKRPKLVITDSQVFKKVAAETPADILLTSFSILFARYKGNLTQAVHGARALNTLQDGDKILMSKYAGRTYKKYALLAGFTEIGETLEETVQREVMEEVGLKVKNIRYYKSQPWSFTDTLLMGFYCDLDGEAAITLDREELAMAEWFQRDEIPVEPERDSITNEMIIRFKNGEV